MDMEQKIGFIGFGNMAQAMAAGWRRSGAVGEGQMLACAKHWDKLCTAAAAYGVQPCRTAEEVVRGANVIIVAVKPYLIEEVLTPLRGLLAEDPLPAEGLQPAEGSLPAEGLQPAEGPQPAGKAIVSVAAGWLCDRFTALLPGAHHVSIMPNTPVRVCEGVILMEDRHTLTEAQAAQVRELLGALGLVERVEGRLMGIGGTVSGCGPAFASMFLEALGDAGVKHGLPRAAAYRLAAQMLAGTGRLQLETGEHPGAMKDAVCSPGGTTIVGVAALERGGMRAAVIDAVDAIQNKK
ncbi:MAG: pyrroline-5-carboxylate reductase [Subdoligranulum sp.]|nr:pyrroline-5-carboxylate reductase [Subdoligranulum sp.]